MAKGTVTDQDLETSLQSLGGLGGIAPSGARRDSPFGSDFARRGAPDVSPESARPVELNPVREFVAAPVPPPAPAPPVAAAKPSPPVRSVPDPRPRVRSKAEPVDVPPEIPARGSTDA